MKHQLEGYSKSLSQSSYKNIYLAPVGKLSPEFFFLTAIYRKQPKFSHQNLKIFIIYTILWVRNARRVRDYFLPPKHSPFVLSLNGLYGCGWA